MNDSNVFFKLFTNCIFVEGEDKGVILDYQRQAIYEVDKNLCEILPFIEEYPLNELRTHSAELYKVIMDLETKELGFLTSTPELFPAINDEWDVPSYVNNAIIEYGLNSTYSLSGLLAQIRNLNCTNLVLIINGLTDDQSLKIFSQIKQLEFYNVDVWFYSEPPWRSLKKMIGQLNVINSIKIFNSKTRQKVYKNTSLKYFEYKSPRELCEKELCPIVLDYTFYCESLLYNNCLNRKIAINSFGEIKNCLYLEESFGNLSDNFIVDVIEKEDFKKMWYLTKDSVDTCKLCEYRYACLDCRAFTENPTNKYSKPLNCKKNDSI